MKFSTTGLFVVLMGLCKDVLSQRVCNVSSTAFGEGSGRVINTQQDFDTYLSNCTSIAGALTIGPNFTGSLNITGVTSIEELTLIAPPFGLTDILLNDVTYINTLELKNMKSLRQISAPNLAAVGSVDLSSSTQLYLSFPALTTVESQLVLKGWLGSFNVPLLGNVSTLDITNDVPTGDLNMTFKVDLPSLFQARVLSLYGNNIASVSVPQLRIVQQKLYMRFAPAQDLDFPLLKVTNNTDIATYGNPDFSSLTHAEGTFYAIVSEPSIVSFPQLTYAENIRIWGRPLGVNLPVLSAIYSLWIMNDALASVAGNGILHCAPANAAFQRVKDTWGGPTNPRCAGQIGQNDCGVMKCDQDTAPITSSTKIGIAAGIAIGTVILSVAIVWWWIRKRKEEKKARADRMVIELEEMEARERRRSEMLITATDLRSGRRRNSGDSLPAYEEDDRRGKPLPAYTVDDVPPPIVLRETDEPATSANALVTTTTPATGVPEVPSYTPEVASTSMPVVRGSLDATSATSAPARRPSEATSVTASVGRPGTQSQIRVPSAWLGPRLGASSIIH